MSILAILAVLAQADTADSLQQSMEVIAYSADSIVLTVETRDIVLVGSSRIDYRDMALEADTVHYEPSVETVRASGSPELFDRGESIRGSRMFYSLRTRRGRIEAADSRYEFGYYSGSSITQVGPREFNITDARFTTCENDSEPDYYIRSPRMKVFQNERAVARPAYLYISDTPVFYIPFGVFPLRQGRQSGFTIPRFGQTSRDGRYLRGFGYYFAFSDYIDLLVDGDIMERTRFAASVEERHALRYVHSGRTVMEWRREFQTHLDRWRLFGEHLHDLADGTTVRLRGEFLSDRSYLADTHEDPYDRMEKEIRSWASVNRMLGRASVQLVLDRTQYLGTDPDSIADELEIAQSLPDLRVSLPSSPVFGTPSDPTRRTFWNTLYWNLSSHYIALDNRREETRTTHSGLRTVSELTASNRLWGILSLSPHVSATMTVYDRDRSGNSLPWWISGAAGITAQTDLYGVFQTGLLGYSALRHTITPGISFGYVPGTFLSSREDGGFGTASADSAEERYYSFSDLSLPSAVERLTFSLFQRLEGRRVDGDMVERADLATLEISTTADLGRSDSVFTPLTASLTLAPFDQLSMSTDAAWDFNSSRMEEVDFTTTLRLVGSDPTLLPDTIPASAGMPWRLSLSHYYRLGIGDAGDLSKLRASAALSLTPSWSIEYGSYYDLLESSFITQTYTLRRDLHCWEAIFTRHISDADTGFYFRINIKELPDIKIEQHVSQF
jgi:lipopolysaccharide assembly outer membrane protein LptD (OstA)